MNVYTDNGYKNRADYLKAMSEEFDVPIEAVFALASVLGSDEDFDGLVSTLEDFEYYDM